MTHADAELFWSKVARTGSENECWEWTAAKTHEGYGTFWTSERMVPAHRFAWQHTYHADAGNLFVLHACDNRACCNPAHLFLGTQADNVADCIRKGRFIKGCHVPFDRRQRGEARPTSKLTDNDVREIRRLRATEGLTQRELAARFGVCQRTITLILSGRAWTHVVSSPS